jgi:hypothetical protein
MRIPKRLTVLFDRRFFYIFQPLPPTDSTAMLDSKITRFT